MILDYCLGLLTKDQKAAFEKEIESDPELKAAINSMQERLHSHMGKQDHTETKSLQDRTWALIENVIRERNMDPENLPLLNRHSEATAWATIAQAFLPKKLDKTRPYMRLLTNTGKVTQVLIATSEGFPDEEHDDLLESFMILDGECECRIGAETIRVRAGGYVEIPLHTSHDVRIISDSLVGVLQRISLTENAPLACH